jgi:hypothetical protein
MGLLKVNVIVQQRKSTSRPASIREQQASLVRWLSAMLAEASRKLTEARLAATETLAPAEARREPTEAQLAATEGLAPEEGPKRLQEEPG